jgi:predicted Holliday junction resolvase-like endonuclease
MTLFYFYRKIQLQELKIKDLNSQLEKSRLVAFQGFTELFEEYEKNLKEKISDTYIPEEIMSSLRTKISKGVMEKFVPFSEKFANLGYDPADAKFLGEPIDYIVFKGLSKKKVEKIAFVEIKSGKGSLSEVQEDIRKIVTKPSNENIEWEIIDLTEGEAIITKSEVEKTLEEKGLKLKITKTLENILEESGDELKNKFKERLNLKDEESNQFNILSER